MNDEKLSASSIVYRLIGWIEHEKKYESDDKALAEYARKLIQQLESNDQK